MDDRPIQAIYLPEAPESEFYTVGHDGVTKIEAIEENGEMAPVPWLEVYKREEVVMRSAARHWIIEYAASGGDHNG